MTTAAAVAMGFALRAGMIAATVWALLDLVRLSILGVT